MKTKHAKLHPLLHSAALVEKRVEALLSPTGVRHRQALILDALQLIGPTSQRHLAEVFNLSPGSISTMTERLVALGFITQSTVTNDRRRNHLELTHSGRTALEDVRAVWQQVDDEIEAAIAPENRELFFASASDIRKSFGGRVPGGEPTNTAQPRQTTRPKITLKRTET